MHSTVLKRKGEANLSQHIRHNMDNIKKCIKDFPGGPVVKTAHFRCREHKFYPWWGTRITNAVQLDQKKVKSLSHVRLFATPWTVAHQTPASMGFSRQEYWSGLPFSSPGNLPNQGIEPRSPTLQADALTSEPPGKPERKKDVLIK